METNMPIGDNPTEKYVDIPISWRIHSIQELIDKKHLVGHLDGNHGELYPSSHEFTEVGIPYIGANDFSNGYIDYKSCKYLPEERARIFKKGIAKDGDVLFAHNATVGPVALIKTKLEYVILSTTATYFRCNQEKLFNIFLLYALQAPFFVSQYQSVMAQSTRNQVPITVQRKFSLLLPPLREQKAIAQSLSDVDAQITALDQLITKKRNIKQSTMQQLLTGKKRLPGFSGQWEVKSLEEISLVSSGGTPNRNNPSYWNGKIPWITTSQIDFNTINSPEEFITEQGLNNSSAKIYEEGTLLMAMYGQGKTRGKVAILAIKATTNQACASIRLNQFTSNKYVFFYLSHKYDDIRKLSNNGNQENLNGEIIKSIRIPIPSLPEQKAIAQVLSDMDAEIEALEQKRDKYKSIKQGMMQELLTGKTRLISSS